ncbi:MAG: TetR family transcriptional regulator [Candidatus Wallbacteria bacterium]
MSFHRARSEEQIQARIQEIVNAASIIYDSAGYEGLSFSAISEHTKFTRPNIYNYFKTKDEILLIIMKDDFKSFVTSLIKSFKLNKLYSINEICEIWTNALIKHIRLLDLYALLSTFIEKNVSIKALSEFKKEMAKLQSMLLSLISQLFPNSSDDNVMNFFYFQLTLAFGLYPASKMGKCQIEALKLAGVSYIPPEFKKTYQTGLYQLMYCLQNSIYIEKNYNALKKSKKGK